MKKVLSWNALLTGILMLIFAFSACWTRARHMSMSLSIITQPAEWFWKFWQEGYCWLALLGVMLIIAAVVMLILLRKSDDASFAGSTVLVTAGIMLLTIAQMVSLDNALQNYAYLKEHVLEPFRFFYSAQLELWLWLIIPAALLLLAGIGIHFMAERKMRSAAIAQEQTVEEPTEEPAIEREERRITLYCTVIDIRGDYALVKYDDSGVESEVALALLPFGIDSGDKLKYENYEFTQV